LKNEKGFTLIEMLVVLMIITVLLFLAIPNISKHSQSINKKGCDAFVEMVQGQTDTYEMDHHSWPTSASQLKDEGYLTKTVCPNGNNVVIDSTGHVSEDTLN
jgi:competence protein ComGC